MAKEKPAKKSTKPSERPKPPKLSKPGARVAGDEPLRISSGTGPPDSTLAELAQSPHTYGLALFIDVAGADQQTLAKIEQFVNDMAAVVVAVGKIPRSPGSGG